MMKKLSPSLSDYSHRLDSSIRPQDNFFDYVNKKWLDANPIPDSETRWGSFQKLSDQAYRDMKALYKELEGSEYSDGSTEQQAKDMYYTGMHYDDYSEQHLSIVHELLEQIDQIKNNKELSSMMGTLHSMGVGVAWGFVVDVDEKNSNNSIACFEQSGLTLPDKVYYLDKSDKLQTIRKAYERHAKTIYKYFPELGKDVNLFWEKLWNFEVTIAKASKDRADLRDREANYNPTTYQALKSTYNHIDWNSYANKLGWKYGGKISVNQPEFLSFINKQFESQSLDDWKSYMKWRVVMTFYGYVNSDLANLKFDFFGAILGGSSKILPLWKRVVICIDELMGEAVGKLYVQRHFPESSKKAVLDIVEELRQTYAERIDNLEWMNTKTKKYAKQKLTNIKVLIGYPDVWRDFSKLKIGRSSYLENIISSLIFMNDYELSRLHIPVSRNDWLMSPQTVNAYHDPNRLVICFPAAILQPPFFDPKSHIAANMGGIGTVIGHEFTHGFDDQGCMFDANGNMRNWQTDEDRKAFSKRAKLIIAQANEFEALPGLYLIGDLVIGESIADLGGVEISYHALKNKLGADLQAKAIDEITAEQLFFVNYAIMECGNIREEQLHQQVVKDPHPIAIFRVNGILQHTDDFLRVYNAKPGDKLYRKPNLRSKIW